MTKSSDTSDSSALGGSSVELRLKNFKGFADSGSIRIAPITLLFGENSSGKSSIIQAYMAVAMSPFAEKGVQVNTQAYSMRSFDQVVKDDAKSFSISTTVFGSSLKECRIPGRVTEEMTFVPAKDGVDIKLESIRYTNELLGDSVSGKDVSASKEVQIGVIKPSRKRKANYRSKMLGVDHVPIYKWTGITNDLDFWNSVYKPMKESCGPLVELLNDDSFDAKRFRRDFSLAGDARDRSDSDEEYLKIVLGLIGEVSVEEFRRLCKRELSARGYEYGFQTFEDLAECFRLYYEGDITDDDPRRPDDDLVPRYLSLANLPIDFHFIFAGKKTRYLSAYREKVPDLVQRQLGERLSNGSWFSDDGLRDFLDRTMDRLALPYAVEIDDLDRTDYFKIWLLDQNTGKRRHPSDVGFGIGQIVQILTRLYLDSSATAAEVVYAAETPWVNRQIIEEPEAHLHPKLQRNLSKVLNPGYVNNCEFLIETHSEALVMGYLEEIREGRLNHEDLSIVYVEQTKSGAVATSFQIDEFGEFVGGWPEQLFPIVD